MTSRVERVVRPIETASPEIAAWLWALEDARRRLKEAITGIDQVAIDWQQPAGGNTIGTLLYHIALIEADYLYADVLGLGEDDFPAEMRDLFPFPDRDPGGLLWQPPPHAFDEHVARLDKVRRRLRDVFTAMSAEDYRRPRPLAGYDITPEWTLHHLAQHEAEHRGQIMSLRELAETSRVDSLHG